MQEGPVEPEGPVEGWNRTCQCTHLWLEEAEDRRKTAKKTGRGRNLQRMCDSDSAGHSPKRTSATPPSWLIGPVFSNNSVIRMYCTRKRATVQYWGVIGV